MILKCCVCSGEMFRDETAPGRIRLFCSDVCRREKLRRDGNATCRICKHRFLTFKSWSRGNLMFELSLCNRCYRVVSGKRKTRVIPEEKNFFVKTPKPHHPYPYKRIFFNKPSGRKGDVLVLHRFLMECKLGRSLSPDEIVHHKDGDPQNNTISNLELTTNSEHIKSHHREHRAKHGKTWTSYKRSKRAT